MFLLFFGFFVCQFGGGSLTTTNGSLTDLQNRWYGPSYQPSDWMDIFLTQRRREFEYSGSDGSMIGLSIGVVLGSIRALSLDGVPHSADETPVKALLSHIIGGLISGALIGLVYIFFKGCVFK